MRFDQQLNYKGCLDHLFLKKLRNKEHYILYSFFGLVLIILMFLFEHTLIFKSTL